MGPCSASSSSRRTSRSTARGASSRCRRRTSARTPPCRCSWRSPIGWQLDPAAFRDTLIDLHRRYRLPIYVTENGAGAVESPNEAGEILDRERIDYLRSYGEALREAVAAGADVRGYFVWSLLDNFEWGAGYANRFGLVHVDFATQRRVPKASAHWYARMIRAEAMEAVL